MHLLKQAAVRALLAPARLALALSLLPLGFANGRQVRSEKSRNCVRAAKTTSPCTCLVSPAGSNLRHLLL